MGKMDMGKTYKEETEIHPEDVLGVVDSKPASEPARPKKAWIVIEAVDNGYIITEKQVNVDNEMKYVAKASYEISTIIQRVVEKMGSIKY